ncbi:MAG: hypothetical protein M1290_06210 [Candidatus Thermoplasmatota archaeon]|jgi:hypothetical protein|nr:hypothetical protein [Candidatus Thermoplasmatota archaeon]MCL5790037.1 hypothetical protein [Candidatus Thermoplasmatota archaeon]
MTEDYEILRELKREGEEIIFSEEKKRMMLLSEGWDSSRTGMMEDISKKYGIDSRQKFQEFKEKYNLTDY